MGLFRSLGFGIFLLILSVMMPAVFSGLELTLLALFDTLQTVLGVAGDSVATTPIIPTVK